MTSGYNYPKSIGSSYALHSPSGPSLHHDESLQSNALIYAEKVNGRLILIDDLMLVGSDGMWVRLGEAWSGNPTLRWRIVGNGHTHRGVLGAQASPWHTTNRVGLGRWLGRLVSCRL